MRFVLFWVALTLGGSPRAWAQAAIDTSLAVRVGGIEQWINISGNDASNPLLLLVGGGPGDSYMTSKEMFTKKLQAQFVVVIWDQRESGKTLQLNASPTPLTFAQYQEDTRDLIQYLLRFFNRPKLYLVGFSWGTTLGLTMAAHYPHLLYAYVGVSQIVHQNKSEQLLLERLKEQATALKNQTALRELARISIPFNNKEDLYYQRKWLFKLQAIPMREAVLKRLVAQFPASLFGVMQEAFAQDFAAAIPAITCPIYFFSGRKDYQTNHLLAYTYYQQLQAPDKHFYWFDNSAHLIPFTEPALFQQFLLEHVLRDTAP